MFLFELGRARTSAAGNPITFSYTVNPGDALVGLLLKVNGATNRAGGSPTLGAFTFTQANTTQKAAASPEASAELWYLLNPVPGVYTLTIPNTGALTIFHTVVLGRGGSASFVNANGGNGTSTNPTPGAVTVTAAGSIGLAVAASGATNFSPATEAGTPVEAGAYDDGANGGGQQYVLDPPVGAHTLSWTFGTSDDWGAVSAYFNDLAPHTLNNFQRTKVQAASGLSVNG